MKVPENSVSAGGLASASMRAACCCVLTWRGGQTTCSWDRRHCAGLFNILARAEEMSQLQPYNRPTVLGYIEVMGSLWKGIRNRDGSSNSTILRIILNTQTGLL